MYWLETLKPPERKYFFQISNCGKKSVAYLKKKSYVEICIKTCKFPPPIKLTATTIYIFCN